MLIIDYDKENQSFDVHIGEPNGDTFNSEAEARLSAQELLEFIFVAFSLILSETDEKVNDNGATD